jgi:membrane-associated protease RseP (regulator of RpoE activity)
VTGVTTGSAAQQKGISVGEVIVEAEGKQVRAPKDLAAQAAAKRNSTTRTIDLVVVNAKGERRQVAIELGKGAAGTKPDPAWTQVSPRNEGVSFSTASQPSARRGSRCRLH